MCIRDRTNPLFEREGAHQLTGRIMPIYPLTAGISQSMLYKAIEQGLAACVDELSDILPEDVRLAHQLCHTRYAYENIHFPTDDEALVSVRVGQATCDAWRHMLRVVR